MQWRTDAAVPSNSMNKLAPTYVVRCELCPTQKLSGIQVESNELAQVKFHPPLVGPSRYGK